MARHEYRSSEEPITDPKNMRMNTPRVRVRCESMYRGQYPGTHQEGSEQTQRESKNCQQYRPCFESATFFSHSQRMHQRRTDQPWHEGRVFNRIPEPPAAPAKFVIGPPATQRDTQCQKHPGNLVQGRDQRAQAASSLPPSMAAMAKAKGTDKTDIAHVQHRRMDRPVRNPATADSDPSLRGSRQHVQKDWMSAVGTARSHTDYQAQHPDHPRQHHIQDSLY